MALAQVVALGGLALAVVGGATASDAVSLRELARSLDVPLLSGAVLLTREAMPSGVAHALEPLAALTGLALGGASCWRRGRLGLGRLSAERAGRIGVGTLVYRDTQALNQLAA
jgi:hypothetical protein